MDFVKLVEQREIKGTPPVFRVGDSVKVHVKVKEGEKDRIQVFQGMVIAMKSGGTGGTFTVRKISDGIGVERTGGGGSSAEEEVLLPAARSICTAIDLVSGCITIDPPEGLLELYGI